MGKLKFIVVLSIIITLFVFLPTTFAGDNDVNCYFNSSAIDGNGSLESPYNNLSADRLLNNSNVYFAEGEYDLDNDAVISNISFCGDNTIINGNDYTLTLLDNVVFRNITFININIKTNGLFDVSNSNISGNNHKLFAYGNTTVGNSVLTGIDFDNGAVLNISNSSINNSTLKINNVSNFNRLALINSTISISSNLTIFNSTLNGKGKSITINGKTIFGNVNLTEYNIVNRDTLIASNTIFKHLISSFDNGYGNNYGGAIYAPSNKNIHIDNCSFIDNSAEYGGAIYAKGGNITIINSIFDNNSAYNYGGAISGQSLNLMINNTYFSNHKSSNDAGGVIYVLSSNFKAFNLTIINSSATFGGAITSLKSNLNLEKLTIINSTSRYDGGAIYQLYGNINITDSKFINNTAKNGGGLFIDDVGIANISNNDFINNSALMYAGAIYSLSNDNITYFENTFSDNHALHFDTIYNASTIDLFIGNGNYVMYVYNQTDIADLPSYYNLVDEGYVTPIKNQQDGGNCWAFAALASLESCILKATGEVVDLSEENMKNLIALYSDYGWKYWTTNSGGNFDLALGYLLSWMGPVDEKSDLYDGESLLSPLLDSIMHVQNVLLLTRANFTDNDAIKQAVMQYGAVATTLYWDKLYLNGDGQAYHYSTEDHSINHAVAIVGWNDSVKINNAPGNGAWICKNSWGESWIKGYNKSDYFYVSYYDKNFARPGSYASCTFILNDTQHFDKNYQYDISGKTDYLFVHQNTMWYENAFYATDDEFIAGVSTYFLKDTNWQLAVYVNSSLQLEQSGFSKPGYYTINLNHLIPLVKGDLFEVIFKITVDGDVGIPISEIVSLNKLTYAPNNSFISPNNVDWYDLYSFKWSYLEHPGDVSGHTYDSQVACIKAFTKFVTLNSTLTLNVTYDSFDVFNITAHLLDEFNNPVGNGEVTFTVNGVNYTQKVYLGYAAIQVPLVLGKNNISAVFNSVNYVSSNSNTFIDVEPVNLNLNITVVQDSNNAYVSFTFSQAINETLIINDTLTVKTVNGTYTLVLSNLGYGQYDISAILDSDFYICENSTDFFVNFKKTDIEAGNLTIFGNQGSYDVKLIDEFNQPVVNREVKLNFSNQVLSSVTDENGVAVFNVNLKPSVYPINIAFEGDDLYIKSQNSSVITVYSSVLMPVIKNYALNSIYGVYLLDKSGNPLDDTQIIYAVNNVKYSAVSDNDGKLTFKIMVNSGNTAVTIFNPDTNEVSSQKINVIKRIAENKAVSVYFGNNANYKVRVCDDDGKYVSGIPVTFTINGKKYVRYTDANGYASYAACNFKIGYYTITAEYKGYKVSNKITVKSTIITKNIKVKKGKVIKFQVKLLNKNGKILKSKKITFKFKGKTYKVKTNKNGMAVLKITKKYKVGKYTVTSSYGKAKITNVISIVK